MRLFRNKLNQNMANTSQIFADRDENFILHWHQVEVES